jgi:hypothetical protein
MNTALELVGHAGVEEQPFERGVDFRARGLGRRPGQLR